MFKSKYFKKLGMGKIFLWILLLLMTTCNEEGKKKSDTIVIGFSQGLGNHPWREAMNYSMEIQASLHSNVSLKISKAENSVKKQIADIQKMINDNVDAIIISPIEPDLVVPVVKKAYARNIPVILVDRKINSSS